MQAIKNTNYTFRGQTSVYHGKVRDVYDVNGKLVMVASDRISAFDHILLRAIPFKGQVLNGIATFFLDHTKDLVPNWLEANPHPNVSIGKRCMPIKLEMVVRGYLAGHAWREYKAGRRIICGVKMPEGMQEGDKFPMPIITPATKAEEGHDEDISKEEILRKEIISHEQWDTLEEYSLKLFERGTKLAEERSLILVDTKYEFGFFDDQIILIDEIHTPDSSRYYLMEGYKERQQQGVKQIQLSKEFVREWLMANGFQGKEGQEMPEMPDEFVNEVSERYIELYELLTNRNFVRGSYTNIEDDIIQSVETYFKEV